MWIGNCTSVDQVFFRFLRVVVYIGGKKIKLVNGCRIPPNHQSWDFKSLIIGEMADNFRARKVIYYVVRCAMLEIHLRLKCNQHEQLKLFKNLKTIFGSPLYHLILAPKLIISIL